MPSMRVADPVQGVQRRSVLGRRRRLCFRLPGKPGWDRRVALAGWWGLCRRHATAVILTDGSPRFVNAFPGASREANPSAAQRLADAQPDAISVDNQPVNITNPSPLFGTDNDRPDPIR